MQEVEYDGKQWTFYGLGNFIFNAAGRYSTFHAPPYSLPLVIDFSIDHGRITPAFRIYPIVSDNAITSYQPRFVNDAQFSEVYDLLKAQSHWDAGIEVKRERDSIAFYLRFDDPTEHLKETHFSYRSAE